MHNRWRFPIWVLVIVVIVSAIGSLIVAFFRNLTPLESVLLQFIALAAGLGGSYFFGLKTEGEAAKTLVEPCRLQKVHNPSFFPQNGAALSVLENNTLFLWRLWSVLSGLEMGV